MWSNVKSIPGWTPVDFAISFVIALTS